MARRKSRNSRGTEIDRISTLPDSMLCEILSFLPTRTSVAIMSLVSRRWRHLWKHLQVFRFDDSDLRGKKFVLFVNAVLALRKSRNIRKFHLSIDHQCERYGEILDDSGEMWILAAVGPHLEEMSLESMSVEIWLPPFFLMNCTNLVSLSLCGEIYMDDKHSLVYFPSLKKLETYSEVPFLSGCPRLETLDSNFKSRNCISKVFAQPPSSSESLNSINVFPPEESEFVDPILKELRDNVDEIYLTSCHSTSKWPFHAPVLNCPEFRNLHHLKFILRRFNSNLLLNVLEKCHVLQVLIIKSNKEEPSPLRTWEPHSTKTPKCFKSHLTYIHIEGYQGFEDELTFAEYILRKGLVLETMLIFVDTSVDITNKSHSIKRLTNIKKGSVRCQLKFDPYWSP